MKRMLSPLAVLLLSTFLFTSCKKDNNENETQPTTPVDNNIVETHAPVQKAISGTPVGGAVSGYYQSLPWYYYATTKKYPLLIFIPGGGQFGNGTTDLPVLLKDGVAELIDEKRFPASFTVNGNSFSFIVLSPQLTKYPTNAEIKAFIDYARQQFRIDSSRIYISGLSLGGSVSADVAAVYSKEIAAVATISGESQSQESCQQLAASHMPVWDFHNSGDPTVNVSQSNNFITWINSHNPSPAPKQTIFQATVHDAWTKALDPAYKENNMNVYEWMLQYTR